MATKRQPAKRATAKRGAAKRTKPQEAPPTLPAFPASPKQVKYITDLRDKIKDLSSLSDEQRDWLFNVDLKKLTGGTEGTAHQVINVLLELPDKDNGAPQGTLRVPAQTFRPKAEDTARTEEGLYHLAKAEALLYLLEGSAKNDPIGLVFATKAVGHAILAHLYESE